MTDTKAETPRTDEAWQAACIAARFEIPVAGQALDWSKVAAKMEGHAGKLERDLAEAREEIQANAIDAMNEVAAEERKRKHAERDAEQLRAELAEARKTIRDADGIAGADLMALHTWRFQSLVYIILARSST